MLDLHSTSAIAQFTSISVQHCHTCAMPCATAHTPPPHAQTVCMTGVAKIHQPRPTTHNQNRKKHNPLEKNENLRQPAGIAGTQTVPLAPPIPYAKHQAHPLAQALFHLHPQGKCRGPHRVRQFRHPQMLCNVVHSRRRSERVHRRNLQQRPLRRGFLFVDGVVGSSADVEHRPVQGLPCVGLGPRPLLQGEASGVPVTGRG